MIREGSLGFIIQEKPGRGWEEESAILLGPD
jgi:hypothetical protein